MGFQVYNADSGALVLQSQDARIVNQYGSLVGVHPNFVEYVEENLLAETGHYRIDWQSCTGTIHSQAVYAGKQWDCYLFSL